jgi:uncharacterized membrane protein YbhN (UPF0104 family)
VSRPLRLALQLGLVAACLAYALWGLDFARFAEVLARFSWFRLAAAQAFFLVLMVPPALRLAFLLQGEVGFSGALAAELLGLALNNILPARLGELGKAAYLRRQAGINLGRGLGMIFWERFYDLNAVLALGLSATLALGRDFATYPLLACVLGLWLFLFLHRVRPGLAERLVGLLPWERLRLLASETLVHLRGGFGARFFCGVGLYTVLTWTCYFAFNWLVLRWVAGLELGFLQVLTVFVAGVLGMAVPSSPGGLGVYEAAVLVTLGWFGAGKEEALAAAVLLRVMQYLPTTLFGLAVMARAGLSVRQIKAG